MFSSESYYRRRLSNEQLFNQHVFRPEKQANGESVAKIACQVKREDAKVSWLRDELPILLEHPHETQDKYKLIENGKERVLVVKNVGESDQGEYVCQSQSGRYRVTLFLTLENSQEVSAPERQIEEERDENEIYFPSDENSISSFVSSSLVSLPTSKGRRHKTTLVKDLYIHEGLNKVELKCMVKNKDTKVNWHFGNRPLDSNNQKYEIKARDNERILLIKNPTQQDQGDYLCESGKHKVVLTLNVNKNTTLLPSTSIKETTELTYYINNDRQACLKCNTKNKNDKVKWIKDNYCIVDNVDSSFSNEKYSFTTDER